MHASVDNGTIPPEDDNQIMVLLVFHQQGLHAHPRQGPRGLRAHSTDYPPSSTLAMVSWTELFSVAGKEDEGCQSTASDAR